MERIVTKKEATKRLPVTPEKHRKLDHISIDRNMTLIEVTDEAISLYLRHIESSPDGPREIGQIRTDATEYGSVVG